LNKNVKIYNISLLQFSGATQSETRAIVFGLFKTEFVEEKDLES
jgi:hypothetical protein